MAIASPSEPVYYYECSGGRSRLVYFIPPQELERLYGDGGVKKEALRDFPDGVDLSCTEPDFAEFEDLYGFRPTADPEALQRAFAAILSTTREWQTFQGSGFIPAADLEGRVETVDKTLRDQKLMPEDVQPVPDQPTLRQRRQWMARQAIQQTRMQEELEKLQVHGLDPKKSLREQKFSAIQMGAGETAPKVFEKLHRKRKG